MGPRTVCANGTEFTRKGRACGLQEPSEHRLLSSAQKPPTMPTWLAATHAAGPEDKSSSVTEKGDRWQRAEV